MMHKPFECKCIDLDDKNILVLALLQRREEFEQDSHAIIGEEKATSKTIRDFILPRYDDLIERIQDIPRCEKNLNNR